MPLKQTSRGLLAPAAVLRQVVDVAGGPRAHAKVGLLPWDEQ